MHRVKIPCCHRGATAIEYALIMAMIAVALVAPLTVTGNALAATMTRIAAALPDYADSLDVPGGR